VVDFALQMNWPLRLFAFNEVALYDLGLQKPDDAGSGVREPELSFD
jgi:hypothetical protein